MKSAGLAALISVLLVVPALASSGVITKSSPHSVEDTAARFEQAAKARGMTVFPRFDHAAAAKANGKTMPPAIVLSFGNPKYGTPFMVKNPMAAIDFPPKALVHQDADGKVWLSYNTAEYLYRTIFDRHGLKYPEADVAFYAGVLEKLAAFAVATSPPTQ